MIEDVGCGDHLARTMWRSCQSRARIKGNCVIVIKDAYDPNGRVKSRIVVPNLITAAGLQYYAQLGAGETPGNFYATAGFNGIVELYDDSTTSPNSAPAEGNDRGDLVNTQYAPADHAVEAGYPKTNDTDINNTGGGSLVTVTYKYRFESAEGNTGGALIRDVIITNPSPATAEPIMIHVERTPGFAKSSDDIIELFINHVFQNP